MNIRNKRIIAVMMIILSGLSLYASLMGLFDKALYYDVYQAGTISKNLIWGSQAQDIISVPFSILLVIFSFLFLNKNSVKSYIIMLGLAWYFFYAFGLYTIQGQYTSIYIIYLIIFGLSFYSLVFGVIGIKQEEAKEYELPRAFKKAIAFFLIGMIMFLYPVWIIRMSPDIANHVPGPTYAVFILDLCLVLPAVGIIAYLLLKGKALGTILAGVALLKIITLCFSWAFSELSNPFVGNEFIFEMALISSSLTLCGLIFFIPYIAKLKRISQLANDK